MTRASGDVSDRHEGIIVLASPRSGTTLLRRLLDAHPNIACPGETGILSGCARFLRSDRIAENVTIGAVSGLGYAGFDEAEVLARLREFAFSFHREHARRENKARWAEKTAFDAFYLAEIEQLCGEHAYFVGIERHGLDVATSIVELCEKNGGYLPELHEYIKRYPRPLEAFAHAWVDLTVAVRGFVERHPDNAILIHYEDLVREPEKTLRRVLELVGESWHDSLVRDAMSQRTNVGIGDWKTYGKSAIDGASVERWRSLSERTLSTLAPIVNETLVAGGYDEVPASPAIDDEDARRRYQLGLMVNAMKSSTPAD